MTRLADRAVSSISPPKATQKKLSITVLYGGPGSEREVSLKSGSAVAAALESLGHAVHRVDLRPEDLSAIERPVDVVFIALHGTFGEDGRLQQILDQRGVRYCGSGAAASALAMDKVAAKCRFIEEEIPTPTFDVVTADRISRVLESRTPPLVVKPVAEGSSVDCRLARGATELRQCLQDLTARHGRCLLEQYISGLELTVGVLGDQPLPPIQIRTRRSFYDYQAKYLDNDTEYLFDIVLPREVLEQVKTLSVRAHKALGCRDFSRVDWMVDAVTHQPYALEVNTIPGFTDHSLLPKAAERAGLTFAALCQRIIDLACAR
jgi:D-alanine-D-alanine ligase